MCVGYAQPFTRVENVVSVRIVHQSITVMVSRTVTRVSALLFLSVAGLVISTVASGQTLAELEKRLVTSNPSIASARMIARQARHRSDAATAWEPPSVGVEFNMLPPLNPNPARKGETMVMLEQAFPLGGQNRAMSRAMASAEGVGEAETETIGRRLVADLRRSYFTLWYIDRRLQISHAAGRLIDILRAAQELRYSVSLAPQSELLELATEAAAVELELSDLARWRSQIEASINALLARPIDYTVVVVTPPPDTLRYSYDSLAAMIGGHPELKRMEAMSVMSGLEADAERAMLRPMLMLRAGLAWMPDGHPLREAQVGEHGIILHDEGVMRWGLKAGAMITIPIAPWSIIGPDNRAEVRLLEAGKALSERDDMRNGMEGILRTAYLAVQRARAGLEYSQGTSLPLLEQRLEAAREDYANGRVPFTSLIQGYRALVAIQIDLAQRRFDQAMAIVTIAQITGVTP